MYNYHLSRKKSRTFIEYYKEDGHIINIHYGDGSVFETNNTEQNKKNLNAIQEDQLSFGKSLHKSIFDEKNIILFFIRGLSLFALVGSSFLTLLSLPGLGLGSIFKLIGLDFLVGFPYLAPNLYNYSKYFLNKALNKKFNLFMKYKEDLNSRVELVEEDVDSKSMNPVVGQKSSILNLSINDVHFMKYSELKKITEDIDVAKFEENRINAFSEVKVKAFVKVKKNNNGGYELC